MKNILVPTDFSPCSGAAYSYAALVAEKTKAEIHLLHVIAPPYANPSSPGDTPDETFFKIQLMKLIKSRMSKIRTGKIFNNLNIEEHILVGQIPEKIAEAVKKLKIDMVIMGTHGLSGVQEKFIGSNAEKIVRNAEIPVLTVKHEIKKPKIEHIVLATDFSKETEYVLPTIAKIAKIFGAEIILTKIITLNDFESTYETEKQIRTFKEKNKLYNFSTQVYYSYSREEGIRRVAHTLGAGMIAMGTHGRHGLSHLFLGSIAEEVVNHASLPVLTINFHKKLMEKQAAIAKKKL